MTYQPPNTDKRDECGCHKGCGYEEHSCSKPCQWPDCLNDDEMMDLLKKIGDFS